jgi:hypothetical protein
MASAACVKPSGHSATHGTIFAYFSKQQHLQAQCESTNSLQMSLRQMNISADQRVPCAPEGAPVVEMTQAPSQEIPSHMRGIRPTRLLLSSQPSQDNLQ